MTRPGDVQVQVSPDRPVGRSRGVGYWAFVLHRASGLVLTLYLLAHLAFLSALYRGPAAYNAFVRMVTQPVALFFDVLLVAAVIYHAFNGARLAVLGFGLGRPRGAGPAIPGQAPVGADGALRQQASWFWVSLVLGLVALGFMTLRMLAGE